MATFAPMPADFTGFHSPLRAAVIGASGGIGSAFIQLLDSHRQVGEVFAFARRPDEIECGGRVRADRIDILEEDSVAAAAAFSIANGPLDLVVVTTGILHDGESLKPEKTMRELDAKRMARVFAVNAIAPAIVAKHFLPGLRKEYKTVFAALSARVGSISDNRLGGWASYRASKSALNMLLRTLSIEHKRRFSESIVAGLHPGTVDTSLSRPFQARVPDEQLFTPLKSVTCLLDVIAGLTVADTGGVFAWDGQRIDY